jgi:flagellar FliL protein
VAWNNGGPNVPEDTEAEEQQVEAPAKSGSGIGKMLMVVLLALGSSAVGGVVSSMLMSKTMGAHASTAEAPSGEQGEEEKMAEIIEKSSVLPLEPFIVNLADADAARYLRIKISLLVHDEAKAGEMVENPALQLKVRDVILQSLTAKTSQDLINESGKNTLRHEIHEKIAMYFRQAKLVDVMFTEFVIQL